MSLADDLPNAPQLSVEHMQDAGLKDDEISAAIHITEEFLEVLSGLVINVAFAKISLEGGNRAQASNRPEKQGQQRERTPDQHPEKAA